MCCLALLLALFYNLTYSYLSVGRPAMAADAEFTLGAVLTLAVFLGVIGNSAVIVSICRTRNLLKNSHYYLLLHLAICDLFYLMFFTEEIYGIFSSTPWISSNSYLLCKIWWPTHTLFFTAGPNFLVIISILRYRAIVQPFKAAVSRRNLKILSTLVYVLAIICIIPYVVVLKFDETFGCNEEWPLESLNIAYTIFLASVQYFIPAALLSVCYFKICKELMMLNKMRSMNAPNQLRQQNEKGPTWFQSMRLRNTKTFLVSFTIVTCFIVCAGPLQVTMIIRVISSKELPNYDLWFHAFYILGTMVLNPCIYGALDKRIFSLFIHCRKKMIRQ